MKAIGYNEEISLSIRDVGSSLVEVAFVSKSSNGPIAKRYGVINDSYDPAIVTVRCPDDLPAGSYEVVARREGREWQRQYPVWVLGNDS